LIPRYHKTIRLTAFLRVATALQGATALVCEQIFGSALTSFPFKRIVCSLPVEIRHRDRHETRLESKQFVGRLGKQPPHSR